MSMADVAWALMFMIAAGGVLAFVDEMFPTLLPRAVLLAGRVRAMIRRREWRDRHPIIKDWKE